MEKAREAAKAPAFDPMEIRKDFPILNQKVYGKPLVYLDNAASAQKPTAVIQAMAEAMEGEYANVHRGLHYMSNEATGKFEAAREAAKDFLNAEHLEEVIFTAGATDAINLVAHSFVRPRIAPGDEIILSDLEHHSNIVPWHYLREEKGAVLKWIPVTDEGELDLEAYRDAFTERTKFVALSHMSNALGTLLPAEELVRIAHSHEVPILLDGCQAAVHVTLDMQALGCDFYAMSGHKLYGPTGIGVLYGKRALLEAMPPYRGGGEMISLVSREGIEYADLPHKFEAGTPAILEAIGLGAALRYFQGLDRDAIAAHEADLLAYATERLRGLNSIRIIGTAPEKGSILSFVMEGAHPHDLSMIIDRSGVAIRAGHHCAQPLMDRFDVPATARASFAMYNTREEVDIFVDALLKAQDMLG